MSRRRLPIALLASLAIPPVPLAAQERQADSVPDQPLDLDIRAEIDAEESGGDFAECTDDQEAAELTGEIVVCRTRTGDEHRLYDREKAERRHAEKTAYKNDPEAPDFILDCKEQGMPLGCVTMGGAPEKVYMIDFANLPATPEGSDAERRARGLAPRGISANPDGTVTIAGATRAPAGDDR